MTTFDQYIADGDKAIRCHPDFDGLEYATAATDMIASILHAVEAHPEGADVSAESLLASALESYAGDLADRPHLRSA